MISGQAPSSYVDKVQNSAGISEERMDEILQTHVIDPIALRLDEFDAFFEHRSEELLRRIERAMGKSISRDQVEEFNVAESDAAEEAA